MNTLQWTNEFTIGHEEIDKQHQQLIRILNRAILVSNTRDEEFHNILHELVLYTKQHFLFEEQLMKLSKYPGMEEHIQEHEYLIEDLSELMVETTDPTNINVHTKTVEFLKGWLTNHIMTCDKKYADYVS